MSFQKILNNLAEYIKYNIEEGNAVDSVSPEILKKINSIYCRENTAEQRLEITREKTYTKGSDVGLKIKGLEKSIAVCTKCSLHETRTKSVPGQGSMSPEIMFIGEAPGADEDRQGLAFVGRAGKLLTEMIAAMGYNRDEVFIGNILKCRPPENRPPMPNEVETCIPYLKSQISLLKPQVIIALGATAVKGLLNIKTGISKIRGQWMSFENIDLMPTYHPAYLLRNPHAKKDVWTDLQAVLKRLGRKPPKR